MKRSSLYRSNRAYENRAHTYSRFAIRFTDACTCCLENNTPAGQTSDILYFLILNLHPSTCIKSINFTVLVQYLCHRKWKFPLQWFLFCPVFEIFSFYFSLYFRFSFDTNFQIERVLFHLADIIQRNTFNKFVI